MKRLVLLASLLRVSTTSVEPAAAQLRPPSLDSVRLLGLDSVANMATAYFRPQHRARALQVHSLLRDFLSFYRERIGVETAMRVAVLDSADWPRITNAPYGLPTNSGLGTANLLLAATTPPERIGSREMPRGRVNDFLTIGHEGGHLLMWQLLPADMRAAVARPERPPAEMIARFQALARLPAWYQELVANYFATAFLATDHPSEAAEWAQYVRAISAGERPRFTHLDEWFGRVIQATADDGSPYRFSAEGARNQGWYQGVVGQVAAHLHRQIGLGLIPQVRSTLALRTPPTTAELVKQLESIAPGVVALLRDLGAGWE
jgi:hypothetical protein